MFKNGEVICFLGDSITASGLWEAEVYQHIGKRLDIKCYNCGVSGSTASLARNYFYSQCMLMNPDCVVIMFGVNDINRWALSESYRAEHDDAEEIVRRAIIDYRENIEFITNECQRLGARVILCTPMPYDEYNEWETENLKCDYALQECAVAVRELSEKYGTPLVDFRGRFLPLIKERKPIAYDRVHPTPDGYHMMAQVFLSEIGEIDEPNFDEPFVFEDWNKSRHEAERPLKLLDFIDYVTLYRISKKEGLGIPEKIERCRLALEATENKAGYIPMCQEHYVKNASMRDEYLCKLVSLTVYPRLAK